ncbi:hypothetical protein INT47_008198 [Mucor saturninus]|uniref:Uncharacterized protein n=1 Tax=Mucor saturninus TaxID=64648 RepID=A0A8H7R322_9FUNG|nr:hypothetical protein INT47_008198 [Mucor saturninus]
MCPLPQESHHLTTWVTFYLKDFTLLESESLWRIVNDKKVAANYYLGSAEQFSKIKVIFVQAAAPAYELWLEGRLDINHKFECKLEQLPKIVKFYWLLKCLLEDSVENISTLIKEHHGKN